MKIVLLFALLALAFSWGVDTSRLRDFDKADEGYCRRKVTARKIHQLGDTGRYFTYIFWAVRNCAESGFFQKARKRLSNALDGVRLVVSSKKLPYFHLAGFKGETEVGTGSVSVSGMAFSMKLVFVTLIEYEETSSPANGFMPGEDLVHARYDLWSNPRLEFRNGSFKDIPTVAWTPITIEGAGEVGAPKVLNFELKKKGEYIGTAQFSVVITPRPVYDETHNMSATPVKAVYTPNSIKLNLRVLNVTYRNASSSGMAIGAILVTKKRQMERTGQVGEKPAEGDKEYADEVTEEQDVAFVPSEEDETRNDGFFSWKKKILKRDLPDELYVSRSIHTHWDTNWDINNHPRVLNALVTTDGAVETGYTARFVWFSFDGRPSELIWDPALGFLDGATSIYVTLFMAIAMLLFFF